MTRLADHDAHGVRVEPATLRITRRLPGPVERLWRHLTDSDLRRQWLAAGAMAGAADSTVELVWRNEELSDLSGGRPAGFPAEQRMVATITAFDPPRRLALTRGPTGKTSLDWPPRVTRCS
jgi:uncharacterized protein YndB with AHSA1/START domain